MSGTHGPNVAVVVALIVVVDASTVNADIPGTIGIASVSTAGPIAPGLDGIKAIGGQGDCMN